MSRNSASCHALPRFRHPDEQTRRSANKCVRKGHPAGRSRDGREHSQVRFRALGGGTVPPASGGTGGAAVVTPTAAKPKRFHGTVVLDSTRVGRDASRVADEVVSHLTGLVGANVKVTLEIEAVMPDGASEQIVRTVTENSRTLKFTKSWVRSRVVQFAPVTP